MSDNKKYLGWGLVGTPNGRQYTSDGVDKQLNQAKIFELEQAIGGCLPDPKLSDFTALYVLRQRNINNASMLGFGEYFSINESGQARGGYLGSFIEVVNATFGSDSVKEIFHALRELSIYQTRHFIDTQKKEYHTSINNKPFESPHEQLNHIAEQLQPPTGNYLTQTPQESSLFIHCERGQSEAVAKILLTGSWFYRYQNIFFTENEHICNQIMGIKIEQLSSDQLLNSGVFTQPWQTEVGYLHMVIKKERGDKQTLREENQHLKTEQSYLVAQEVEQQAGQYKAELEQVKQQLEFAKQRLQESDLLAQLGKQVFDVAANNAEQFGNSQLAQYSSASSTHNEIISRLTALNNNIMSLNSKLEGTQSISQQIEEYNTKSPLTLLLGVLSSVLLVFALVGWGLYWMDDSVNNLQKATAQIQQIQKEKNTLQEDKQNLERELEQRKAENKKLLEEKNTDFTEVKSDSEGKSKTKKR